MQHDVLFWIVAGLAAFFVGLGKGGLPIIAALSVPSLSLFMQPIAAAGLLLPVYIVSDVFALMAYRREYDRQVLKISFWGLTFGVIVGALTAHLILEWVITLLIGAMGAVFALRMMIKPDDINTPARKINPASGYFWTAISGFTSFISHNGAPPWQIFTLPLRLPKTIFVGTSVIAFAYCNFIKLIPYIWLGQLNFDSIYTSAYLMLPAAIAVFVGVKLVKIVPEIIFYKIITWALMLISLKLIFDGIRDGIA